MSWEIACLSRFILCRSLRCPSTEETALSVYDVLGNLVIYRGITGTMLHYHFVSDTNYLLTRTTIM